MPVVSVLYLEDPVVGPHLQLLRYVCNPASRSRPHVTVRFSRWLPVPDQHLKAPVQHLDLVGVGEFVNLDDRGIRKTVYVRCESEELLHLEYKPDYPYSEFHITVYDGRDSDFADAVVAALQSVSWGVRVRLPRGTHLTSVPVRGPGDDGGGKRVTYPTNLKQLYRRITSERLTSKRLDALSPSRRIEVVKQIADHLDRAMRSLHRVPASGVSPVDGPTSSSSGTPERDVDDLTPRIFVTPPELASAIAKYAISLLGLDQERIHFGDPAVGTGAFFGALLEAVPKRRIASAVGIDIGWEQVEVAKRRWAHRGMEVLHGDFLKHAGEDDALYLHLDRLEPRNLILANPPYLRHQEIPHEYKRQLQARASVLSVHEISGRAGLYVYFLLFAHQWMQPGAVAAWLIPSEFMQTDYGAVVREYLTHSVRLLRVHQFEADVPQFENVWVLPAVVVFRNEPPGDGVAEVSVGGSLDEPNEVAHVPIRSLAADSRWRLPYRGPVADAPTGLHLGELFDVHRGLATGANDFFIMTREEASDLGIPSDAVRPILPKARHLDGPVVEAKGDGYPDVSPSLVVIDCDWPEDRIARDYPRFATYLETAKERGVRDRALVKRRTPWYRQEHREPAPFLCTYMGRAVKEAPPLWFIWNKSKAVAANTYLLLYPKAPLRKALGDSEPRMAELFEALRATAVETVREASRRHAGGLHKIEPGELRRVRLSGAPDWMRAFAELRF